MDIFGSLFNTRVIDIFKSAFPSILAFFSLMFGIKVQQGRENKKEQIDVYIRNGLENQILSLTKLKENLIYSCLMYIMLFRKNGGYDSNYFKSKIKELYVHIEPSVGQIRMHIFGNEFCEALEILNLVTRKQLYDLEMLAIKDTSKKDEFALIVFETEAILQYVIVKYTTLLNITQTGWNSRSLENISNNRKVKVLREELKMFSTSCIKLLGTKDKEQIWNILRTTLKSNKEGLARMGILVEALDYDLPKSPVVQPA